MEIGKNFYQYKIETLIGEGAIARNWRASHISMPRNVRIKQMKTPLLQTEQQKNQLRIVASQQSTLQNGHIQFLYDYLENSQGIFFVYDYTQSVTLDNFLAQKPSEKVRKEVFVQILDAMAYSHRKEVLHLNLSPSNIFVDAQNQVKITDFGFSVFHAPDGAFVSPEYVQKGYLDTRSDIYSLGRILQYIFPNASEQLQQIVRKACNAEVYQRYQTSEAFKTDFLKEFFIVEHQEIPKKTFDMKSVALWTVSGFLLLLGAWFVTKNLSEKATKPKTIVFEQSDAKIIQDTTNYTKVAEQKAQEDDQGEEVEKTVEEKEKDSLNAIRKKKKEAREKRRKEYKDAILKKVIVDGQLVSNQLGEYKVNIEAFNSHPSIAVENLVIVVSYFNAAGDVSEKEEKTLPRLAAGQSTSVEITKKINASRFICKVKDAQVPPDPNEKEEEQEEEENPQKSIKEN